jgi:tetratricopeptide (TPR) repeat protein
MMYIGDKRMRQHGIFARASSHVVYNMIWMMAQCAVAHAQAAPAAAIFVDRAVLAYDERRYERALQELREALRLDPDNVDALYYQGLVYIALDRPLDAIAAWERARALRPSDLDVPTNSAH